MTKQPRTPSPKAAAEIARTKLRSHERKLLVDYAGSLNMPSVYSPLMMQVNSMVMALPWCESLSESDVTDLIIGVGIDFQEDQDVEDGLLTDSLSEILAGRLEQAIETFSKPYTVYFSLPGLEQFGEFTEELSSEISISSVVQPPPQSAPAKNNINNRLLGLALGSDTSFQRITTLQIKRVGYGASYLHAPVTSEAISIAKRCAFVLKLSEVVTTQYFQRPSQCWMVNEITKQVIKVSLPDALATMLGQLSFNPEIFIRVRGGLLGPSIIAASDEERVVCIKEQLGKARQFFAQSDEAIGHIHTAIEWYEDSLLSQDQTIAFISACIGLESILGDANHIDEMTLRLADRYAFLLGRNRAEREQLSAEFRVIFKTRGRLVHARVSKLGNRDLSQLNSARAMLKRCLLKEVRPLFEFKS